MTDRTTVVHTTVNGRPHTLEIPNRLTLADLLREELGLTGTKVSCELQVCGVCTVLIDGAPVSACTYLAVGVDGREVTTIEGLAGESGLHPIQQAFLDEFALQCGFCTPGFVMMAKALLDEEPYPDEARVTEYLDGSICRCTGYRPIVDAVLRASRKLGVDRDG